jgi:hypothetical protein
VAGRLLGKRAIVTDPMEYNGADIVALFREEGAEVFAESWDMTKPEMADEIVREVGHVDILIANRMLLGDISDEYKRMRTTANYYRHARHHRPEILTTLADARPLLSLIVRTVLDVRTP